MEVLVDEREDVLDDEVVECVDVVSVDILVDFDVELEEVFFEDDEEVECLEDVELDFEEVDGLGVGVGEPNGVGVGVGNPSPIEYRFNLTLAPQNSRTFPGQGK